MNYGLVSAGLRSKNEVVLTFAPSSFDSSHCVELDVNVVMQHADQVIVRNFDVRSDWCAVVSVIDRSLERSRRTFTNDVHSQRVNQVLITAESQSTSFTNKQRAENESSRNCFKSLSRHVNALLFFNEGAEFVGFRTVYVSSLTETVSDCVIEFRFEFFERVGCVESYVNLLTVALSDRDCLR